MHFLRAPKFYNVDIIGNTGLRYILTINVFYAGAYYCKDVNINPTNLTVLFAYLTTLIV